MVATRLLLSQADRARTTIFLIFFSTLDTEYTATATLERGDTVITVTDATGLSAGDEVWLALGEDTYDSNEEDYNGFNRVYSVSSNDVTLVKPIPKDIFGTSQSIWTLSEIVEGCGIQDLSIDFDVDQSPVPDQGIIFERARNCYARNIFAQSTWGAMEIRESENILIDGYYIRRADFDSGNNSSGRCLAGWGSTNVTVRNVFAEETDRTCIFVESQNTNWLFDNISINVGADAGSGQNAFQVAGGSENIYLRNYEFSSARSDSNAIGIQEEAKLTVENAYLWTEPKSFPFDSLHEFSGSFWYREKLYSNPQTVRMRIDVADGLSGVSFNLPSGLYTDCRIFVNSVTGLQESGDRFYIFNGNNAGGDVRLSLVANDWYECSGSFTTAGTDANFNYIDDKRLQLTTGSSVTVTDGTYAIFEGTYLPMQTPAVRGGSTAYSLGDWYQPAYSTQNAGNYRLYEVTTAGTTAGSAPTFNTAPESTTTDGTATVTARYYHEFDAGKGEYNTIEDTNPSIQSCRVTIANTDTTGSCTWAVPYGHTTYTVLATATAQSASAAADSAIVTDVSKTTTAATLTIHTAPGSSEDVTFDVTALLQ